MLSEKQALEKGLNDKEKQISQLKQEIQEYKLEQEKLEENLSESRKEIAKRNE